MVEKIKMFVRQHHKLMMFVFLVFLLALMAAGVIFVQTNIQLAESKKQLEGYKEEKKDIFRRLAKVEVEASILRNSELALRHTIDQQQQQIAEQEKALDFYRQLMTSDDKKKGFELNDYLIRKLDEPNTFYYRFTFVQYAKKHLALRAGLSITVEGESLSGKARFNFRELIMNNDDQFGKLRFKYFKVIEGQIKLPEDFTPRQLIIDAQLKTKKPKVWQRKLGWTVEES